MLNRDFEVISGLPKMTLIRAGMAVAGMHAASAHFLSKRLQGARHAPMATFTNRRLMDNIVLMYGTLFSGLLTPQQRFQTIPTNVVSAPQDSLSCRMQHRLQHRIETDADHQQQCHR